MNTVTNAGSSYYTANVDETTEKGPCVTMTPYGVIGLERESFHSVPINVMPHTPIAKYIVEDT